MAPGTATKELVLGDEIVPEPPVKRTRSGRAAKPTAKAKVTILLLLLLLRCSLESPMLAIHKPPI